MRISQLRQRLRDLDAKPCHEVRLLLDKQDGVMGMGKTMSDTGTRG